MTEVWIVDDDQSIRWVLERALEKEGFAVRSFDSAGAVDDAMQSAVPGAVISDIRMPGIGARTARAAAPARARAAG